MEIDAQPDDYWLSSLKKYQLTAVRELLVNCEPEEAAKRWLSMQSVAGLSHFGGDGAHHSFYESFHAELRRFLCDADEYQDAKKEIAKHGQKIQVYAVSIISASIAAKLGVVTSFIVPAVVLTLITIGKIGLAAWCHCDTAKAPTEG